MILPRQRFERILVLSSLWGVSFIGASVRVSAQTEVLNYQVEWRFMTAGRVKVAVTKSASAANGKLEVQSLGIVSMLFKVNENYEAVWRPDFCAQSTHLFSEENKRHRETTILYNGPGNKTQFVEKDLVKNTTISNSIAVPACVADVLGGLQKLRALKLTPGTSSQIPISDGKKFVEVKVDVQEKENVKTATGTYKTVRMEAFLFNGVLYDRAARCLVWVTDDEKRIPVKIQILMRLHIGTVTLLLDQSA